MFAYKIKNADNSVKDGWHIAYTPTRSPVVKMFDLGTIMAAGSISPAVTDGTKVQSRRVVELALPTETNTLLFYGKAIKSGSSQQQGSIEMSVSPDGDLAKHSFRLNKIIPDGSDIQTEFLQSQTLIAAVLTKIIRSDYTTTEPVTVDGKTLPANSTIKWSVEKPFYLQWWAFIIYLLILVAIVQRFLQHRTRRLKAEKIKLETLVAERTSDLKRTQDDLVRMERTAAVGKLTQGLIDRILNPINYINNFSKLTSGLAQDLMEDIEDEKDHMSQDHTNPARYGGNAQQSYRHYDRARPHFPLPTDGESHIRIPQA